MSKNQKMQLIDINDNNGFTELSIEQARQVAGGGFIWDGESITAPPVVKEPT